MYENLCKFNQQSTDSNFNEQGFIKKNVAYIPGAQSLIKTRISLFIAIEFNCIYFCMYNRFD